MALDEAMFSHPEAVRRSRPRRLGFLTTPLRLLSFPFRLAGRLIKLSIAGLLRLFAYHPVSSLIVTALLVAVAFLGYLDFGRAGVPQASRPGAAVARSAAAEDFIKGQETFNAALMWQSFSDELKTSLQQNGTNPQSLQRQLDQRRQSGARQASVQYVGGVRTSSGVRQFFYSVENRVGANQQPLDVHYIISVDQTDKIISVE